MINLRLRKNSWLAGTAILLSATLGGCISPVPRADGTYTTPIGGAPVIDNETPYSAALRCLGKAVATQGRPAPRVAVGNILDYTGKYEADGSGKKLTQGAALMAMSALNKAGVRLVERFDTSVAELELKYANNKLIGDKQPGGALPGEFRRIYAGSIPGSDFYLVGGITELNYNIRSAAADLVLGSHNISGLHGSLGLKLFVMNVGLDLRLIRTQTLEVVKVISYQKQILGREISPGMFDFLGSTILDIGAGERALEPIQLAVRAVTERAVLEMLTDLFEGQAAQCPKADDLKSDPLSEKAPVKAAPAPAAPVAEAPAPAPVEPSPETKQLVMSTPIREPGDAPKAPRHMGQ